MARRTIGSKGAPRCTMIVFIDDATSHVVYAKLVPAETTQAYFDGVAEHPTRHGRPLAYYSDRHSIFRVNGDPAQPAPTQFQRALKTLDIDLICAHSPQAKGRVERVHQTFQDRFTKALLQVHLAVTTRASPRRHSIAKTPTARSPATQPSCDAP